MNKHLGEGTLQALLDGELSPAERSAAEAHLAACGECAAEARELRVVNERMAALLAQADIPAPVAQAQMSLRARRLRAGRWSEARKALLRAAILVMGVAGVAAAAVPGSPVREWVEQKVLPAKKQAMQPSLGPTPAQQPVQPAAASAPSGVSIRPDAGVVRVVLTGASPKLRVTARLVDGDRAGVLARGKAASGRFRTAPGRIEVVNAGDGELEVEIPRGARAATVQVNGHVYVAKDGDSLRVLAPADGPGPGPDVRVGG